MRRTVFSLLEFSQLILFAIWHFSKLFPVPGRSSQFPLDPRQTSRRATRCSRLATQEVPYGVTSRGPSVGLLRDTNGCEGWAPSTEPARFRHSPSVKMVVPAIPYSTKMDNSLEFWSGEMLTSRISLYQSMKSANLYFPSCVERL